jgi:inorganic pyrophosphatase
MNVRVFIQNEAGSNQKHYHDEKTLEWKRVATVSSAYPFPYGFIVGTSADDGCSVDCFVLTASRLRTGQVVDCQVVGLMEQFEDGHEDHNVLAVLPASPVDISEQMQARLSQFVMDVFKHIPGKRIAVGQFAGPQAAESYVKARFDQG